MSDPFIPVATEEQIAKGVAGPKQRAIDLIRQRAKAGMRLCRIEEWGLDLYFGPLTASDFIGIMEREPKTHVERNLMLLILKARDAEGQPVFSFGDLHMLKTEVPYPVLQRAIAFMFESAFEGYESAKQELAADPTSASGSV